MNFDECAKRRSETRKALRQYLMENKELVEKEHGFKVIKSIKGISKGGFHKWILEIVPVVYEKEAECAKSELFVLIQDYLTASRDLATAKQERKDELIVREN